MKSRSARARVGVLAGTSAIALLAASCIGNPGSFTIESDPNGSWMELEDSAGNRHFVLEGLSGTLPVEIDANGQITYDPSDIAVEPVLDHREVSDSETWIMRITMEGSPEPQTGNVTSEGVDLPLPATLKLDAVEGYPGLGADCEIGPIDGVYTADNYDLETGEAELVADGNTVPSAENCGDWTDVINAQLGLPTIGNSILSTTILDQDGNPIEFVEN